MTSVAAFGGEGGGGGEYHCCWYRFACEWDVI